MQQNTKQPFAIKGDGKAYIGVTGLPCPTLVDFYWDGGIVDGISQKTNVPKKSIFSTNTVNLFYTNYQPNPIISIFCRLFFKGDSYFSIYRNVLQSRVPSFRDGTSVMLLNNQFCVCRIYCNGRYDLIPYIQHGEAGLYDVMSDTFYGNTAGVGYFTAIMDPLNSTGGGKYLKINKIHKCSLVERRAA